MSEKIAMGQTVIVVDRSKPVGQQIVPAIVTAADPETKVLSATGFPKGEAPFYFANVSETKPGMEVPLGWYRPE